MDSHALSIALSDQFRAARASGSIADLLAVDHQARAARKQRPAQVPRERLLKVAISNLACLRIGKRARTLALALYIDAEGDQVDLTPFVDLSWWKSARERIEAIIEAQSLGEDIEVRWHLRKLRQDVADAMSRFDEADRSEHAALARA